ncbi:hypothetical protein FRC06_009302, partial [Ceratobasidium sp. 370]
GKERGHALFDATTLDTQETLESKHQKFRTHKGAYWDNTRKQFHNKSDKIVRGKARRAGESFYPGLTDEPLDGPLPNSRMGLPTPNSSDNIDPLAGRSRSHSTAASTAGAACTSVAAGGRRGTAGNTRAEGGVGGAMGLGRACPASQSPSPIPGTPDADPEVAEHRHFVNGVDPTGTESGYHSYVESLDPVSLTAEFRHFVRSQAPGTETETETETEAENERTETESETETSPPLYRPAFPTHSPSPLPRERVPSVTNALGLLGPPFGQPGITTLGTTQASIQDPVTRLGNPAHLSPTQPRPVDKQPPYPTSANSSCASTNNDRVSTQKAAGSSTELLEFIQNSGELGRALRELHRRQKVAAVSGMALKDVGPMGSQNTQLEQDLVPDNEKERTAQAARAAGEFPLGRKSKPTSRDLHGYERQLISPAKLHLFAYALKKGIIQTRPTFFEWSDKSWLKIWEQQLPNLPPEVASTMVKQIMVNNLATGRGRFKDPIRPLVQHTLDLWKPASTDEDVNHNLQIFMLVHPNTFHCTKFSPPYGHYESDLLTQAIATTMFCSPTAVGVVYHEFFDPMPLTTVAFVLSIIQFCIEEWATGRFCPRDLSMTDLLNKYVAHLRGLKAATKVAKNHMAHLQQHWFNFGLEFSGATTADQDIYQPTTESREVRPDTPEPESEEPATENGQCGDDEHSHEMDKEDCYTTQVKGKDRAQH